MPMVSYKSYIICTSPRSGSTLLCELLGATGTSGNPNSHFHNPSMTGWLKAFNLSRDDYTSDHQALRAVFDAARRRGTGNTRVFGLRMQQGSFGFFLQQLGILHPEPGSDLEQIQAEFGPTLFIHLTRRNKINQAISRVRALQTGLWHKAADGTEPERQSPPQDAVYDADAIQRHLVELTALDEAWKVWFDQENLEPMLITYDKLSADPAGVLAHILDQLGLNRASTHGIIPPVAKLADATNRDWARRFRAERGGGQSL